MTIDVQELRRRSEIQIRDDQVIAVTKRDLRGLLDRVEELEGYLRVLSNTHCDWCDNETACPGVGFSPTQRVADVLLENAITAGPWREIGRLEAKIQAWENRAGIDLDHIERLNARVEELEKVAKAAQEFTEADDNYPSQVDDGKEGEAFTKWIDARDALFSASRSLVQHESPKPN